MALVDYTIRILLEPEIRDGAFYVRETWTGPCEGLGTRYPTIHGPIPADLVVAFMKERVALIEDYKAKFYADFEQRLGRLATVLEDKPLFAGRDFDDI